MEVVEDKLNDKETVKFEVDCEKGFQDCSIRCHELEERSKKAEERCAALELEIGKNKSEYESLEAKFRALEVERLAVEDEVKVLRRKNVELVERISRVADKDKVRCKKERMVKEIYDLTEENHEEDKVFQLMIENKVLECEKKRAEDEAQVWKEKVRDLELQLAQLESLVVGGSDCSLDGKRGVESGLPDGFSREEVGKKVSEWSKPKNGLDVQVSLDHKQIEENVVDLDYTVCPLPGVGSTLHSPGKGIGHLQMAGTPPIHMAYKHSTHVGGEERRSHLGNEVLGGGRVRKQLAFADEGSPNKKMAPSTPGGARPASVGVIDISDSDDERDINHTPSLSPEIWGNQMVCASRDHASGGAIDKEQGLISKNSLKMTFSDQSEEEDMGVYKANAPFSTTPKRKRASAIVTSDSESDDDDDNIPICKFLRKCRQESIHDPKDSHLDQCNTVAGSENVTEFVTPPRRRLRTLRQSEESGGVEWNSPGDLKTSESKYHRGIPTTEDVEDHDAEETASESEGESLGGFIVNTSDVSDGNDASSKLKDASDGAGAYIESENESDGDVDFDEILSRIQRNRDHKSEWEFEADMLAAFGKNPVLCMKAVCALYRQQTADERSVKGTIYLNQRGFSQCDAPRGTALGEFLTDGDPHSDLKKSVKELQKYDPKALELCKTLATRYSKQLFAIYKNKEDPLFLPSS